MDNPTREDDPIVVDQRGDKKRTSVDVLRVFCVFDVGPKMGNDRENSKLIFVQ